jgi:hypothetical protein
MKNLVYLKNVVTLHLDEKNVPAAACVWMFVLMKCLKPTANM